ncbi:MAG: membrane dipeptidase [Microbacterium sp. 14-71-5]|nr:MAG: membrane dipeptidase [Microbacterium sp. 14-71-5]
MPESVTADVPALERALLRRLRFSAATAAFQIEGARAEDGRGRSIWDDFVETPGLVRDGSTAEPGPDSYHRSGEDVDRTIADGRIALVLALEGMPGLDADVELIATMHRLGVRVGSLAHFGRGAFADGSGEDAARSRLTGAGVAAVREMERVGMLLDLSHLGAAGVSHALEIATRPVIATHSSARALRDHHRNLSDEHLAAIAAGGGVICVNFFAPFLDEEPATIDRLVDHLEHIAAIAGSEHVGLGPDFVREVIAETTPPCCVVSEVQGVPADVYLPGLEGPEGLPLVTEALLRRGWAEADILGVLGGNVQRLFRQQLGRPSVR